MSKPKKIGGNVPGVTTVGGVRLADLIAGAYTYTSLAAACGVTEQTVRRWVAEGTVPPPSRYGRWRFWTQRVGAQIVKGYYKNTLIVPKQ